MTLLPASATPWGDPEHGAPLKVSTCDSTWALHLLPIVHYIFLPALADRRRSSWMKDPEKGQAMTEGFPEGRFNITSLQGTQRPMG